MVSSKTKSVLFRADSSHILGGGHVMPCLCLARAMKRKGWDISFATRPLNGNLISLIREEGFQVHVLSSDRASEVKKISQGSSNIANLLVVDHYSLNQKWFENVSKFFHQSLVIDDGFRSPLKANILVNPNVCTPSEAQYRVVLGSQSHLFLGLDFALFHPHLLDAKKRNFKRDQKKKKLLIFYGLGDHTGETLKALRAIKKLGLQNLYTDVVIGKHNPHRSKINNIVNSISRTRLHVHPPNFSELLARTNGALSAGGNTLMELLYLNVPTIVTTTAENQFRSVRHLSESKVITWLGHHTVVKDTDIETAVLNQLNEPWKKRKIARAPMFDGLGAQRIANFISSSL